MNRLSLSFISGVALIALVSIVLPFTASADTITTDFENPPFTLDSVNGQGNWSATNAAYDHAVVENTFGIEAFGSQSFRISDAVTSGSFGDWVFSAPLTDAAGESDSTDGTFDRGTLQNYFETEFDIATTLLTQQPGLHISISPDRGDGSRMSYLRFEDGVEGINVFFDDVQGVGESASFVETQIAESLSRESAHRIKLTIDFNDGADNDIVKVYINTVLVHTGTSWENYFRFDTESVAEQSPRIVKNVIIQARGTATPANLGEGFVIDNLTTASSMLDTVAPSCPEGFEISGGECVATGTVDACPSGYGYDSENNLCKPQPQTPSCPDDGSVGNVETGECEYPNQMPSCPGGFLIDPTPGETENLCISIIDPLGDTTTYVPQCGEGYSLNENLHQCVKPSISACAASFTYDVETEMCVSDGAEDVIPACPAGTEGTVDGDQCTPNNVALSCDAGYVLNGSICVPSDEEENEETNENTGGSNNNSGGSSNSGGGGGGGGGGSIPAGQVLGASTSCFQFTRTLVRGMNGNDVVELQKILIAKGYMTVAANGNFGPSTEAGVKAYQAANGLEQVGAVGPKTRALLNVCAGGTTNPNQALINELLKTLSALLKQIEALKAAQATN